MGEICGRFGVDPGLSWGGWGVEQGWDPGSNTRVDFRRLESCSIRCRFCCRFRCRFGFGSGWGRSEVEFGGSNSVRFGVTLGSGSGRDRVDFEPSSVRSAVRSRVGVRGADPKSNVVGRTQFDSGSRSARVRVEFESTLGRILCDAWSCPVWVCAGVHGWLCCVFVSLFATPPSPLSRFPPSSLVLPLCSLQFRLAVVFLPRLVSSIVPVQHQRGGGTRSFMCSFAEPRPLSLGSLVQRVGVLVRRADLPLALNVLSSLALPSHLGPSPRAQGRVCGEPVSRLWADVGSIWGRCGWTCGRGSTWGQLGPISSHSGAE